MNTRPLWRISIAIAEEAEEAVSRLLEDVFGQSACIQFNVESGRTTASVYVSGQTACHLEDRRRLLGGLVTIRNAGLNVGEGRIRITRIRRERWAESWKRHFKPFVVGRKLLIKPTWSRARLSAGQVQVVLDPGLSFGTGQHPTTRFCLDQIVSCLRHQPEPSLLDVGTGSGILAIAGAKLGYNPVEAFDCDPDSIRIARENGRLNGILQRIRFQRLDLADLPKRAERKFDLVCANLTYDLLLKHRRLLASRMKSGGRVALAGILRGQFAMVKTAYEACGLILTDHSARGEWEWGAFVNPAGDSARGGACSLP